MDNPTAPSILIVDDSRVSRMLIKSLLLAQCPQCTITEVGSGDEALVLVKTRSFDCCTMDINMPGIPGTEAAEQLLKIQPTLRIVLLSANIQTAQHARAAQLGVPFVAKPVTAKSIALVLAHFQALH